VKRKRFKTKQDNTRTLILIAGINGAVGSTVAATVAALRLHDFELSKYLMTENLGIKMVATSVFPPIENISIAGWDIEKGNITDALVRHAVLPKSKWEDLQNYLKEIPVFTDFLKRGKVKDQIEKLSSQINTLEAEYRPHCTVFVNLLPAAKPYQWEKEKLKDILSHPIQKVPPDLAYILAAINNNIPVVNFTSNNIICHPGIIQLAKHKNIPICGNDGKTGQTYLKTVLASALGARCLHINGWYSLNILGNADGKNLSEPGKAELKLKNKTAILDDILGYNVGKQYTCPSHLVRIDYYPPRGDNKEAWDVIDFKGIFDLPMTLRLNLQVRDSILATSMVIDLVRWMVAMHVCEMGGPANDLAFYFKSPIGQPKIHTFQDQLNALYKLARQLSVHPKKQF